LLLRNKLHFNIYEQTAVDDKLMIFHNTSTVYSIFHQMQPW